MKPSSSILRCRASKKDAVDSSPSACAASMNLSRMTATMRFRTMNEARMMNVMKNSGGAGANPHPVVYPATWSQSSVSIMTSDQPSPLMTRNSSSRPLPNVSKLCISSMNAPCSSSPNRFMPSTLKMKMARNSREPTLAMDPTELSSVANSARRPLAFLSILNMRPMRKVRNTMVPGPMSSPAISGTDPATMKKSNLFQGSAQYLLGSSAPSLSAISSTKTQVKRVEVRSLSDVSVASCPSCCSTMTKMLPAMQNMMKYSKPRWCTRRNRYLRMKNLGSSRTSSSASAFCFCFIFSASAHCCCPLVVKSMSPLAALMRR
mmetsp:Transcript_31361/g.77928  ORF Transcript_31361/g.77928 Transcript_31361/m.77928 type:complete len:319 (-) Transcript_31361:1028-1984(-)